MTNQELNIAVAEKLGINWHISPENNEENNWSHKFPAKINTRIPYIELLNYCNGEGIADLMFDYNIGAEPIVIKGRPTMWTIRYKGRCKGHTGSSIANLDRYNEEVVGDKPWRKVCEVFLNHVDVGEVL